MSSKPKTCGELIAEEFSRDKCHLTDAEQRRLASMIDMQIVVGWSEKYVAMIHTHLDECRRYIAERGMEESPELRSSEDMRADTHPEEAAEYHRLSDEAEATATENSMRQSPVSLEKSTDQNTIISLIPRFHFAERIGSRGFDGSEEGPFGRGETQAAAIASLNDCLEERS